MSISTHILDTSIGSPAAGVEVTLARLERGTWVSLATVQTDAEGRAEPWPTVRSSAEAASAEPATFRLSFATGEYFAARGVESLYPSIEIQFRVQASEAHYHLPLLLSPHGYTTYRGS